MFCYRKLAATIAIGACLAGCRLDQAAILSGLQAALGAGRMPVAPVEATLERNEETAQEGEQHPSPSPGPAATPAPRPKLTISGFEPPVVWSGRLLKVHGEGFSPDSTANEVVFTPGVRGEVQGASEKLLVIQVPRQARSGVVWVLRRDDVATGSLIVIPIATGAISP